MLDDYELGEVVAVQWCAQMAEAFPNADHTGCLQSMQWIPGIPNTDITGVWQPFTPPLCHGWHCPRCGVACGQMGHRC